MAFVLAECGDVIYLYQGWDAVSSPDEILRRELRCFIWWWNTVSNPWYYFSNKMILEREIKDAKMRSFSSDFQPSLNVNNFLSIVFSLWIINEFEKLV